MAVKIKKVAARGFVNNKILECLLTGDKYGYEIIKEVEEKSNGKIILKQPSLYSSLKRFETKGYITSYWGDSDIGGRRHYYTITNLGKSYYEKASAPSKYANFFDDDSSFWDDDNENNSENKNANKPSPIIKENQDTSKIKKHEPVKRIDVEDIDLENYDIFSVLEQEENNTNNNLTGVKSEENIQTTVLEKIETKPLEETILTENKIQEETITIESKQQEEAKLIETKPIEIQTEENIAKIKTTSQEIIPGQESIFELQQEVPVTTYETHENKVSNITKETSTPIQFDMFSNEVIEPTIKEEEKINLDNLNKLKEEKTENQEEQVYAKSTKQIPLIKEKEQNFFNWEDLKRRAVANNKSFSSNEKTYRINPTNSKKQSLEISVDEFGIIKNSNTTVQEKHHKVFDNVGYRLNTYDPVSYIESKQKDKASQNFSEPVLTPDEIEQRNKMFNERIDSIAKQKVKASTLENIDYRNILGELLATDENNNIETSEESNKSISNLEPVNYELNNDMYKVVPHGGHTSYTNVSEVLQADGIKFKPFNTEVDEKENQQDFILINKAKMQFGILMFVLLLVEITSLFIAFNIKHLVFKIDYLFYGISYGIALIILFATVIPFMISPYKRRISNYKFNYALLFGILTFIVLLVLIYALNTFAGFTFGNVSNYLTKLILPSLLSLNFVIAPCFYKMVLTNKSLYK